MKHLVKKTMAIAAALCLGVGLRAFGDSAGDVWSIVQCDSLGTPTTNYVTAVSTNATDNSIVVTNTIPVKEALYFRVRLWNHRAEDDAGKPYYLPWKPTYADENYSGTGEVTNTIDWVNTKPRIGIFPAGSDEPKFAELYGYDYASNKMFTDLVFRYVIESGDFAFPIDIAVNGTDGPVPSYKGSGSTYYFDPTRSQWTFRPWDAKNSKFTDEQIVWQGGGFDTFVDTVPPSEQRLWRDADDTPTSKDLGTSTSFGYQTHFYVKTVNFGIADSDGNVTSPVTAYSVRMSDTTTGLLVASEAPTEARKFYLWSDNEDAFKVAASSDSSVAQVDVDPTDAGVDVRTVATVSLTGSTATFAIAGVNTNLTANLVLSATPHYNNMSGGARMSDFVTIPVTVGPPLPATLTVSGPKTITATGDRWTGTPISVTLTTPLPSDSEYDIPVTLVPSIDGVTDENGWTNYVFFATKSTIDSETPQTYSQSELDDLLSGVIRKGTGDFYYSTSTEKKELYVFALRSDAGNTVLKIKPEYETEKDTGGFIHANPEYSARISSAVTVTPPDESTYTPTKNIPYPIAVQVNDAYADEESNQAYKLYIKADATADDSSAIETNVYRKADTGILYVDLDNLILPQVEYKTELGENTTAVKVVSPVGKADSGWVEFSHSVKILDVKLVFTSEDGTTSDSATVSQTNSMTATIVNQPYNQGPLYAFLVANEAPNAVDCNWFTNSSWVVGTNYNKGAGLRIPPGATTTQMTVTPVTPMNVTFKVVLCTTETYSTSSIYTAFPSTEFTLNVTNVLPEASKMWMYKCWYDDVGNMTSNKIDQVASDGKFNYSIQAGNQRAFRIGVSDTAYDLDNGMRVEWSVFREGSDRPLSLPNATGQDEEGGDYFAVTTGGGVTLSDDSAWFSYQFASAVATDFYVVAKVWDKASYEANPSSPCFAVTNKVSVSQLPDMESAFSVVRNGVQVEEDVNWGYTINENASSAYFDFSLPNPDTTYMGSIVARVTLAPVDPNEANPGFLEFNVSSSDTTVVTNGLERIYTHTYKTVTSPWKAYVNMRTLDGNFDPDNGEYYNTSGWNIKWEVISTDELPGAETNACYYWAATTFPANDGMKAIRIANAAPTLSGSVFTADSSDQQRDSYTNLVSDASIPWGVSDVLTDLNTVWTNSYSEFGTGIYVRVSGDNITQTNFWANASEGLSRNFQPVWLNPQNLGTFKFDFYDKDGGHSESAIYMKPAKPTKMLKTVANMPSGGNALIPLSSKYSLAKGAGSGHVFASGVNFFSAENFNLTWDCGTTAQSVLMYAFGYRAEQNKKDDGTLDGGKDVALDPNGNRASLAVKPSSYYDYYDSETMYDSFFYGWISATEPGGTEYTLSVNPQMGTNTMRTATVKLPSEKGTGKENSNNTAESYAETYIEAIFSREHAQSDEMGDINDDGIPDYYMVYANYAGGVLAEVDGEGGELKAINTLNDDGDYYPASSHVGVSTIVPGAVSTWATKEQPFNAYREIRGYHDGLNFGMFQFDRSERVTYRPNVELTYKDESLYGKDWISDISLSEREKRSLLRHILNRRDALVKELYTKGEFTSSSGDDKDKEYAIINKLLSVTYFKGMSSGDAITLPDGRTSSTNDVATTDNCRFLYPNDNWANFKTNDIDRTVVDDDTGAETNVLSTAWFRTYRHNGTTEWINVTNYVDIVAYTNETSAGTNIVTYLKPWELCTVDDVAIGNWLDRDQNDMYAAQQVLAKAYINYTWRHFVSRGEWGWTCENRTDPTIDDTDGDGMPDGYEYYMWYAAVVGAGEEQLIGSRFNRADLEDYSDAISSADIASLYNPNVANNWTRHDTDNDGIYDLEEFLIGSSPVHWDTDRDGLSDLYEVMYNMNPLTTNVGNNGAANGDGDFMAYFRVDASDPLGKFRYIYQATNGTYWAIDTAYDGYVSTNKEYLAITNAVGFQVVPFNGGYVLPTEDTTNYVERFCQTFTDTSPLAFNTKTPMVDTTAKNYAHPLALYHHQVHNYFGFDPRTGWSAQNNGTLSKTGRWIGSARAAGRPVNTSAYTAINEYLLLKYRYIMGLRNFDDDTKALNENRLTIAGLITQGTTNPSANYEGRTWGDDTATFAQAQHGADTDGDGVPDGWELYVGVSPNNAWTIAKGAPGYDTLYWDGTKVWPMPIADGEAYQDGLSFVKEYAGTDSCGIHEDCPTIYANHPSKGSRWYNKFFPTDPRNRDTDGDGIADGTERSRLWVENFTFNRWGQTLTATVRHSATYGNPSDSGGSICIKGGGMNPCTIDTDNDGLPDPWERQYAGLLFKWDGTKVEIVEMVNGDGWSDEDDEDAESTLRRIPEFVMNSELYDDLRAEIQSSWLDYIYRDEDGDIYFVMMGMDPTVDDATTYRGVGVRNRDWDGDGLQNWQEYMVQAMRHLRYDDSRTPLLGRDCPGFNPATGEIEQGQWNGDTGFLRTSYMTPFTKSDTNALATAGYPNFAKFVARHPDYMSILGYLSAPPMPWDHAGLDLGNKYMLPPCTVRDTVQAYGFVEQAMDESDRPIWLLEEGATNTYVGATYYDSPTGLNMAYFSETNADGEEEGWWQVVYPKMVTNTMARSSTYITTRVPDSGHGYVGTDPRLWDTDCDGMDDYYELFHGLNPLLGSLGAFIGDPTYDVIANNTLSGVSAWQNAWVGWDNEDEPAYDPIKYPWMMGMADCDADGDGLRNSEEALLANVTSPETSHTDPTPLWMTDVTVPWGADFALTEHHVVTNYVHGPDGSILYERVNGVRVPKYTSIDDVVVTNALLAMAKSPSYTKLYYQNEIASYDSVLADNSDSLTNSLSLASGLAISWDCYGYDYLTGFELNEGYDTDNDWRGDAGEVKSLSRKNSDPLDFNDPAHRQSIWFGGKGSPGALISFTPTTRSSTGVDFFKQFTVEAWIRPDEAANGQDQYIVSRASRYGAWDLESWNEANGSSNAVIRMNFALGIDAAGNIFAETQNTTELSSRVTGDRAVDGVWVHVAATYDGKTLRLYRDGVFETSADTTIIPANGTTIIVQNPQSTIKFPYDMYQIVPSSTIIGGRAIGDGAFSCISAAAATGWTDVATDFFKGSVAEVRTWDGARSPAEISAEYNVSYTVDDVKQKRLEAYAAWRDGATRNDNDDRDTRPAELVQYYNMATLPGATKSSDVRLEPTGFQTNVVDYTRKPGNESKNLGSSLKVGWWAELLASPVGSSVYTSGYVVPWVQNMVTHLPRISGVVEDSFFWSENYAGYTPASFQGYDAFAFPNSMNPYTINVKFYEDEYWRNKLHNIVWGAEGAFVDSDSAISTNSSVAAAHYNQFSYDYRMGFDGISDLIPIGSAFAKRNSDYWDGEGAETAWQETGKDDNANDLPDWWEKLYGLGAGDNAATTVERHGAPMAASEAYIRDLAAGMLPSGATDAKYMNREDFDKNGLPDWWTDIYGVKGDAAADDDNDGLSNYTEFLLSEYFSLGVTFSPIKAKSVSLYDSDYFFKSNKVDGTGLGQLYAGGIFTDHDFIEDVWEDSQDGKYTSRYAWDALKDYDEDGWSTYAEARSYSYSARIFAQNIAHLIDTEEMRDMPTPTLKLTLRYNDSQPLTGHEAVAPISADAEVENQRVNELANIIVQTYTRQNLVVPDATYVIMPGVPVSRNFYLGGWSERTARGTLAPGYVRTGVDELSLQVIRFASSENYYWRVYHYSDNRSYSYYTYHRGTYKDYLQHLYLYGTTLVELLNDPRAWEDVALISVTQSGNSQDGYITHNGTEIGKINFQTGEFELYMSKFSNMTTVSDLEEMINLPAAAFRIVYWSQVPTMQSNKLPLYLGEANTGYVKEGKNTIVAYYDLDGDGKYTTGEPMGTAVADVGWSQGAAEIELTDTSPIITRVDLRTATSDRETLYGTESGDNTNLLAGALSGGHYERVRVVRTLVNGNGITNLGVPNRVIFDKVINLDQRSYLFEGDVLEGGDFDIDWKNFTSDILRNEQVNARNIDPTKVTYRIVLGNGSIDPTTTNNLFSIATVRNFDADGEYRTIPQVQGPGPEASVVFAARPTFKWTMKMTDPYTGSKVDNNSYTAFRVQVRDGKTTVYDSGVRRAPARDLNGVYTFVPNCYVGDDLEPEKNYKWFVTMYNSKFQTAAWSADSNNMFRMNALTNNLGTIKVAVRYFGPANVLNGGEVRVEAFETPDFTGDPVARTRVSAKSSVSAVDTMHTANATLVGLMPGKYYVRAYVDMKAYGTERQKDVWESWGYANKRDGSDDDIYTPATIVIDDTYGPQQTFDVYIEDADTNGNCLPDAWEMVQNKGKLDNGTYNINDTLDSGIEINQGITDNLQKKQVGTLLTSGLSAYIFSVMSNSGVAALVLDADLDTHSSYTVAAASALGATSGTSEVKDVTVTSLGTSDDGVTLTIQGTSTTTRRAGLLGASAAANGLYNVKGAAGEAAQLEGVVQYVTDLAGVTEASWKDLPGSTVTIKSLSNGMFQSEPFTVKAPAGVEGKCFFRVVIKN